jgi:hypothetical protein
MDPTFRMVLGGFALAYGLFTLVLRFVAPGSRLFSKLEPMRRFWGHGVGTALHWVGYTIVPMIVGASFLLEALLAH